MKVPNVERRVSGRWAVIGLVGLIALALAGGLIAWWFSRDPGGPVVAMAPIDDRYVALVRRGFEERGYSHIGVWEHDGTMRWSEALFGVQMDPALTVEGDRVYVLVTEARGNPALHAFDRQTGEFAWKVEQTAGAQAFRGRALAVTDGAVYLATRDSELVVLDPSSGSVRGRVRLQPPGEAPQELRLADDRVLVQSRGGWVVIGPDGHEEPTDAPAPWPNCCVEVREDRVCLSQDDVTPCSAPITGGVREAKSTNGTLWVLTEDGLVVTLDPETDLTL